MPEVGGFLLPAAPESFSRRKMNFPGKKTKFLGQERGFSFVSTWIHLQIRKNGKLAPRSDSKQRSPKANGVLSVPDKRFCDFFLQLELWRRRLREKHSSTWAGGKKGGKKKRGKKKREEEREREEEKREREEERERGNKRKKIIKLAFHKH